MNKYFEVFILISIILNTVVMAMLHYRMDKNF